MIYQVKSYLKFLRKATNHHGVHSPFVYDLVTQCFYDTKKYPEYKLLKDFRKQLVKSKTSIEVSDFGAGSHIFKNNERNISAIAKNAGMRAKRQKLLFRLVRYFETKEILELGTSLGLATVSMAKANPQAIITTVEGCPETAKVARRNFEAMQLKNVYLQNMGFEPFLDIISNEKFDLVFIDGNHNKQSTLLYFETLLKCANNDSIFIFDDIYWSEEMTEAWNIIIEHPTVTVSIDTFQWGLVFFRKEQRKQHFKIRL